KYYLTAKTIFGDWWRILKIEREHNDFSLHEDPTEYSSSQVDDVLNMVNEGNMINGGCQYLGTFVACIGFYKILENWFMILVSKSSVVAQLGIHSIHHIDSVEIISGIDLTKNFYFSFTYNLSKTVQQITKDSSKPLSFNKMFIWNHQFFPFDMKPYETNWIVPIIYGFVGQASKYIILKKNEISVYGKPIYFTLIARRSAEFAGARFFKRGVNDNGYAANEVETEQIVHDASTTKFFSGQVTSFVQMRGSIPLYWAQEVQNMAPKPPIQCILFSYTLIVVLNDPFYVQTAKHFDRIFERHGGPLMIFDLVKQTEKIPRESIVSKEYQNAISYLNQFLCCEIDYLSWDMSRAAKNPSINVIKELESISEMLIQKCQIYHSRISGSVEINVQKGIIRTNCIDCLDRTNAAQFMIGRQALTLQLKCLGCFSDNFLDLDCDAIKILAEMYHDHGDTLALQYGGSNLVNTIETYRKSSGWSSHSRDLINSIKRFYSNSFNDKEKQEAINIFLGKFKPFALNFNISDLPTDAPLHLRFRNRYEKYPSYIYWFTEKFQNSVQISTSFDECALLTSYLWKLNYQPRLESLGSMYAMKILSTEQMGKDSQMNESPFVSRSQSGRVEVNVGSGIEQVLLTGGKYSHRIELLKKSEDNSRKRSVRTAHIRSTSISKIANILSDPHVHKNDISDYERYVNKTTQFAQHPVDDEKSHSEYPYFQRYLKSHVGNIQIPEKDKLTYENYVSPKDINGKNIASKTKIDIYNAYIKSGNSYELYLQ
ncbi:hypothetical protein ROZALSC1DRAFT_29765, partial [Rozella allomycis CSF55]